MRDINTTLESLLWRIINRRRKDLNNINLVFIPLHIFCTHAFASYCPWPFSVFKSSALRLLPLNRRPASHVYKWKHDVITSHKTLRMRSHPYTSPSFQNQTITQSAKHSSIVIRKNAISLWGKRVIERISCHCEPSSRHHEECIPLPFLHILLTSWVVITAF